VILSLLPESSSSIFAFATNIQSGQQPLSRAFTKDLHHGWWQAVLSDGTQQATIMASSFPEELLLPLLWAVRLLLLGANESTCTWWDVKAGAIASRLRSGRPDKTNAKKQSELNADEPTPTKEDRDQRPTTPG
jgi:hypothetical protein